MRESLFRTQEEGLKEDPKPSRRVVFKRLSQLDANNNDDVEKIKKTNIRVNETTSLSAIMRIIDEGR
jgi:hypothetical protein